MRKILAAVIPEPGAEAELREFDAPELELDSAMLEVELSEVCGTDVYLQRGDLQGVPYPLIPGHVSVGRLGAIRGVVTDIEGRALREGERVTFLDVHRTCGVCWYCLVAKASTRCPKRKVYGITYGGDEQLAGGWAEAVYLRPGTRCLPLHGLRPELLMAGGCSLPTALHAMQRAQVHPADRLLVLGSGPVGISCVILGRRAGARVMCIGAPRQRLEIASQVGANAVLDITEHTEQARRDWVLEQTGGRGADITIEASGDPAAVVQGMRWTRDAGRLVVVGQYTDHGEVSFNPHLDLNQKHLEIRGCWGSDFSHFFRAVELLRDESAAQSWAKIPLRRYSLAQSNQALRDVETGSVIKALITPKRVTQLSD